MMMVTESSLPLLDDGLPPEDRPLEGEILAADASAAPEASDKPQVARWYAVQVASSCEKKVKATLEQRAVTLGVDNRILEIEIPQTPGVKLKKDGTRQAIEEKVDRKSTRLNSSHSSVSRMPSSA